LQFLMVGITLVWEDSLRNPQLCHTPSLIFIFEFFL
jgi:hypothetical protein